MAQNAAQHAGNDLLSIVAFSVCEAARPRRVKRPSAIRRIWRILEGTSCQQRQQM